MTNSIDAHFGRRQERESDYLGAIWAIEAGYDPQGAVRLHAAFPIHVDDPKCRQRIRVPFLGANPSTKKRVEEMKALSERLLREPT